MNKTPYFYRNFDGTFEFFGYFTCCEEAVAASYVSEVTGVVDDSFLYRTVTAANEALNSLPSCQS